jgi:predicted PurR-regulated permease PerM
MADPHTPPESHTSSWLNEYGQLVLLAAGVMSLLFLMLQVDHLLNPLGFGVITAIILYPIRKQPVARALLYATMFAVGFWLTYDSGHLLIPFLFSYIIAFVINPVVERLENRGISRSWIAVIFTMVSLGVMGLVGTYTIPILITQISKLGSLLQELSTDTGTFLEQTGILQLAGSLGFSTELAKNQLALQISDWMTQFYHGVLNGSDGYMTEVGNVLTVAFFFILTPFLCFFMIRDYHKVGRFIRRLLTPRDVSEDYTREITRVVGSYLRGQFVVVVISAINLSLGFWLFGVPYALLLGVIAGLTNFVPTLGLWFSVTMCTIVGASMGDPWFVYLPGIYIVFAVEQVLETGFIVPRVVGSHVGLHPLLVMISLLLFGFMFGIWGVLIAVPSAAILSVFYEEYQRSNSIPLLSGSEWKPQPHSSSETQTASDLSGSARTQPEQMD